MQMADKIELRSVSSLIPYVRNARTHSATNLWSHALADRARLPLADLEPLAVFRCGPRWQSALARRINCSPRLVRRWVAGDRPSARASTAMPRWSGNTATGWWPGTRRSRRATFGFNWRSSRRLVFLFSVK